jgi:hypothetical protein
VSSRQQKPIPRDHGKTYRKEKEMESVAEASAGPTHYEIKEEASHHAFLRECAR